MLQYNFFLIILEISFSKIINDNNFKKIRLHDLRHSCTTLLLRNGVPMEEIQKWLGHSSIRITERYDTKDENDIKKEQLSNGN